jgi:hypothetical protein
MLDILTTTHIKHNNFPLLQDKQNSLSDNLSIEMKPAPF